MILRIQNEDVDSSSSLDWSLSLPSSFINFVFTIDFFRSWKRHISFLRLRGQVFVKTRQLRVLDFNLHFRSFPILPKNSGKPRLDLLAVFLLSVGFILDNHASFLIAAGFLVPALHLRGERWICLDVFDHGIGAVVSVLLFLPVYFYQPSKVVAFVPRGWDLRNLLRRRIFWMSFLNYLGSPQIFPELYTAPIRFRPVIKRTGRGVCRIIQLRHTPLSQIRSEAASTRAEMKIARCTPDKRTSSLTPLDVDSTCWALEGMFVFPACVSLRADLLKTFVALE